MISTLEALAVLVALKLVHEDQPSNQGTQVMVLPTWTDNRGDGAAIKRLMTTRYPSPVVIVELSALHDEESPQGTS